MNVLCDRRPLQEDAMKAMQRLIFWHQSSQKLYVNKEIVELSLILSDDQHIHHLNKKYLNEDHPTDVLAFPMDGVEDDAMPIMLLGDVVLSLDMAKRQAKEMGHDILTECRILLVHALLHLLGYDHERSEQSWAEMAEMERLTLAMLGWKGSGLISSAKRLMLKSDIDPPISSSFASDRDPQVRNGNRIGLHTVQGSPAMHVPKEEDRIQLVAVDLDGTMLTSDQQIRDSSRDAIQEAIGRNIRVVVATGKARPGAINACQRFGLYGEQNLISHNSAGIFLQGLVVYTVDGEPITGPSISPDVTRSVFQYALETGTPCVGFTGDEAVTLNTTPEILELHERSVPYHPSDIADDLSFAFRLRYYEPLAKEMVSLERILEGAPIKKIILLSDPDSIKNEILPHWENRLRGTGFKTVVAVSEHLELIPEGVNKWVGLTSLMQSMGISFRSCMAIGDGKNDYEMVKNAAVGVAMGNAVEEVKSVADHVVSSNDEDGIAEAFEKLIL